MVDLVKLEELAKAATPGPWYCEKRTASAALYAGPDNHRANIFNNDELDKDFEDAEFIAAANPATILELLAEIERLREALLDAAECVDDWGQYASTYFKEKHDLEGEVKRIKSAALIREQEE